MYVLHIFQSRAVGRIRVSEGPTLFPGPMFDTPAIIKILFDFTVGE